MNSVNDLEKRQQLRHERNRILTEIHDLIRVEETNKVLLANIEYTPHDSRRMFQAIKNIKNFNTKEIFSSKK